MANRLMTWKEQLLIGFLAAALGVGAVSLFVASRYSEGVPEVAVVENTPFHAPETAGPVAARDPEPRDPEPLVVEVKGAVKRPGVYRMAPGARVDDLIEEAGGPADTADLTDINRAAKLIDATTLLVPDMAHAAYGQGYGANPHATYGGAVQNPPAYTVAGWQDAATAHGGASAGGAAARDGRVNLNTASQAELETLPRVGPATARKIMDYREATPFQSVDDLLNIHGIGEKTLEGLRPHVTVD